MLQSDPNQQNKSESGCSFVMMDESPEDVDENQDKDHDDQVFQKNLGENSGVFFDKAVSMKPRPSIDEIQKLKFLREQIVNRPYSEDELDFLYKMHNQATFRSENL